MLGGGGLISTHITPLPITTHHTMADSCWDAFGPDSDDSDEEVNAQCQSYVAASNHADDSVGYETAVDATVLAITQHFVTKSYGVMLKERVVAIGCGAEKWQRILSDRIASRGMQVVMDSDSSIEEYVCDAAVLIGGSSSENITSSISSQIRRGLLPGGYLWMISSMSDTNDDSSLSEAVWDVGASSITLVSSTCKVTKIQKRACVVNAWSCPWMDKDSVVLENDIIHENNDFPIEKSDTYLQYERRIASDLTVSPSVAERTRETISDDGTGKPIHATVLTDANVQRATQILQNHGLVIIKGLVPPVQTIKWGNTVLADFESAVQRLKSHPERPVDLMNPLKVLSDEEHVFEPLSYREMAMREDLRVDLRSGPEMESLRRTQNDTALQSMGGQCGNATELYNGPTVVNSNMTGTLSSWRFHPSIISILKSLFNPRDDALYKGNFGRWNFGGAGPDGSVQPFRIGQIGSVVSCPGSGEQAIHADTPHLFEHLDCLPCHYCNVFTPGYEISIDQNNLYFKNEFDDDRTWTGNSTIGGTALVHGSHRLSVTAKLLAEEDEDAHEGDTPNSLTRRQMLQLQTLRPALDTGDVLIFDNRTLHYGLANTSQGDTTGVDANAGRRPLLYLNVTQSWFHDPKNWDNRESIFD